MTFAGYLGGSREAAQALSDLRAMGLRRAQAESACRAPKAGTRLRLVYDLLMAAKGQFIDRPTAASKGTLRDLQDFYGLDIDWKPKQWRLRGAYIGHDYHDYLTGRVISQRDL